jgi:hypothetical protein
MGSGAYGPGGVLGAEPLAFLRVNLDTEAPRLHNACINRCIEEPPWIAA